MVIRYENEPDLEYIKYLDSHISNTQRAFQQIKNELILTEPDINISSLEVQLSQHDKSKYSDEEWEAYRNYFYPTEDNPKDEAAFDLAWLHHQHHNPHHWQHWTLLRDSGETVALDMPVNYVIEMLCDWQSFSAKNPDSTAYKWWEENKSKMILSENTIKLVENILCFSKKHCKGRDESEVF